MGWKPTDLPFLVPAPQGESTPAQSTALDTLPRKLRVTVTGVDSLLNLSPPISITVQHQNPQQGDREHLRGGHFLLIITVLTPGRDQALAPPPPGLHCVTLGGAPTLAATKHGDLPRDALLDLQCFNCPVSHSSDVARLQTANWGTTTCSRKSITGSSKTRSADVGALPASPPPERQPCGMSATPWPSPNPPGLTADCI